MSNWNHDPLLLRLYNFLLISPDVTTITTTTNSSEGYTGTLKLSKNRPFTSTEVTRITDNFRTVIGEGGSRKVYFGRLDDGIQVAVKMLSRSSKQGYKEFHAEVWDISVTRIDVACFWFFGCSTNSKLWYLDVQALLLMVVHHRNLVSLIGYCEEFENMALIYEFMSNGNVRQHLSGLSDISIYKF